MGSEFKKIMEKTITIKIFGFDPKVTSKNSWLRNWWGYAKGTRGLCFFKFAIDHAPTCGFYPPSPEIVGFRPHPL